MICLGGFGGLDPRAALIAGLGFALPITLAAAVLAQERPAPAAQNEAADPLRPSNSATKSSKPPATSNASPPRPKPHSSAKSNRSVLIARKLNQDLIDTAARLRGVETKVAATQERLKPLDENETSIRKSLDGRRAVIGEVLAALQRIGRQPPPALIASPEDALQSVRTAMVLGAVLPEMRQEVESLANDLSELLAVRKKIDTEREQLKAEVAALDGERARMAALVEERQKQLAEREKALEAERVARRHAGAAGRQSQRFDRQARAGPRPGNARAREAARSDSRPALSAFRDPGRLAPAVAFASLRGQVPIPVNGVKLKEFGAPDANGGSEKGISIATRAGAQVTAPADGWVVYAGPFRSYGQLLILNVGGGYHVLLAGMDTDIS